ncbi:MAG: VOC family protein [Treponema sp.]|jgi:lactoylglutathione lyase|nr:VOC family protein [Treponema sp.]
MKFDGFHHIGLWVKNAEQSLNFYTNGLGGKQIFSFPLGDGEKTIYLVDLGNNAVVEIIPQGTDEAERQARWAHVAIRTDDTRAAYERALKAGAESSIAPQDLNLGTLPVCNAFVRGPDHELIEFFQVL